MKKYINGIIFTVIGIIIIIAAILTAPSTIAVYVIGGLFTGAGIMSIVQEIINKNKKD